MSESLATLCPTCEAEVDATAKFCWLCGSAVGTPLEAAPLPDQRSTEQHLLRSRLLVFGVAALMVALAAAEPGAALGLAVLLVPPVLAVIVSSARVAGRGELKEKPGLLGPFFLSIVICWGIGIAASWVGMAVVCAGVIANEAVTGGSGGVPGQAWITPFLVLFGIGVLVFTVRLCINITSSMISRKDESDEPPAAADAPIGAASFVDEITELPAGTLERVSPGDQEPKTSVSISKLLILVAVAGLSFGITAGAPGAGLVLAILAVPTAAALLFRKTAAGGDPKKKSTSPLAVVLIVIGVLVCLPIAGFIFLLVVCAAAAGGY